MSPGKLSSKTKQGRFRFSLVTAFYSGKKREFSTFKRYSYFVEPGQPNKTFRQQIGKANFESISNILKSFSIEDLRNKATNPDSFYADWLEPLFFEALNHPHGYPVRGGNTPYSDEIKLAIQMSPYLNGELFKQKEGVDDRELSIPDDYIEKFFEFLFQYNFTIEENTCYDEELELNPEFLGIIFERLVNKADGAVYTPRTEVDFMCRLALVKWLQKNLEFGTASTVDLFHLMFREGGTAAEFDDEQKQGDFTKSQIGTMIQTLGNITVCDPAAGSGAFEVGMMQVLNEILENLETRNNCPNEFRYTPGDEETDTQKAFNRKKSIIANSLYGVEVKPWAVWINQLRLWLSLFIDMPDEMRSSQNPLLPNLNFKVRCGDSLVQRVAGKLFPIQGHAELQGSTKRKVTELKNKKVAFFYNDKSISAKDVADSEYKLFRDIIDAEIASKTEALAPSNKGARGQQKALLEEYAIPEQKKLFGEKYREEITELRAERNALRDSSKRPLVWSIEFAEIFHDRGGFDIIIGNPPYVQKEDIADPCGTLSIKDYKDTLKQVVRSDYPSYFLSNVKINGHSDLYVYFYLHTLKLLNQTGTHCFICSNSWLDAGYGTWMQEFLLRNVQMHCIIDNHAKRSFASADVNTVISVMDAPCKKPDEHKPVKFIAFKKPFEESLTTENLLAIEQTSNIKTQDAFRVYPITPATLQDEGCSNVRSGQKNLVSTNEYTGDKWGGKYLRAPDFFLKLLTDKREKLLRLGDSVDGQPIVELLGYVHDNNTGGSFPDTKFIRSIRETRRINLDEQNVYLKGVNLKGNSRTIADILFPRTYGRDHLVLFNLTEAVGKEFYRITAKGISRRVLALYMNSSLFILQRELIGLSNLGGGALKFAKQDILLFYIPHDLVSISKTVGMKGFTERDIRPIFEECGIDPESRIPIEEQEPNPLPDRKELDDIVFDALDLTADERKEVYRAVCRLVWNRISKAKSV